MCSIKIAPSTANIITIPIPKFNVSIFFIIDFNLTIKKNPSEYPKGFNKKKTNFLYLVLLSYSVTFTI